MNWNLGISSRWTLERTLPFIFLLAALWAVGDEFSILKDMKIPSSPEAYGVFSLLIVGSVLNWGLEGYKWHCVGSSSIGLKYGEAMKGVLSGVAIGMWMPGRVGAWVGKLFFVQKERRKSALFPLLVSSAVQFTTTVLSAGIALLILWVAGMGAQGLLEGGMLFYGGLFVLLFIAAGTLLYALLQSSWSERLLRWVGMRSGKVLAVRDLPMSLYGQLLGLAFLRYCIILLQFVLIVRFFVPTASFFELFLLIPLVLFLVSVIPSPVLAKLGVREWVVVAVLAPVVGHGSELLLASMSIWTVNLLLPALLGGTFLLASGWRTLAEG